MWKLSLVLLLVALAFEQSEAACGVCNTNSGVACISKNEFQICNGVTPITTQNFTCPNDNDVCTTNGIFCASVVSGIAAKAACGDESNCGVCDDKTDNQFTCTSRTTFTRCSGGELSEQRGECQGEQWCDAKSLGYPCVSRCDVEGFLDKVCDREEAIDAPPPTEPPPTEPTTQPPTAPPPTEPTTQPPTAPPPSEPTTQPPTAPPPTEPTTQPPTAPPPTEPTTQPPTAPPPTEPTTQPPTAPPPTEPTTQPPTAPPPTEPTTQPPTAPPPTEPTTQPPTTGPTPGPSTQPPTQPTTKPPTQSSTLPGTSPEPPTQPPTTRPTDSPTTQPPATVPTTKPPSLDTPEAVCAAKNNAVGRFPYQEKDCSYYVNCYTQNNVHKAVLLKCPEYRYFNRETQTCEDSKPIYCP